MNSHFTLRPLASTDAQWIFEACQDFEIQKWTQIPRPYTHEHAVGFATTLSGDVEVWVIESDDTERPYGVIGVHSINPITRISDIGYWCAPWGRRQGAMRNGLMQFLAKMKGHQNVAIVQATIAESNIASRKTAESVGFMLTGEAEGSCICGGEEVSAVLHKRTLEGEDLTP
jgi:RimJ/RimL family protein N-acetyltransferase